MAGGELAKENGQIIAAEIKRSKLCRFYVKQTDSGPRSPFADMSDEELAEFIRANAVATCRAAN